MSKNSSYRMSHIDVYCTTHISICAHDTGIDDIDYVNESKLILFGHNSESTVPV